MRTQPRPAHLKEKSRSDCRPTPASDYSQVKCCTVRRHSASLENYADIYEKVERSQVATEGKEKVSVARPTIRMNLQTYERAKFWASREAEAAGTTPNFNDFVSAAVENEIARRSGVEIDADNILTGRINQMADAVKSMETQLDAMSSMVRTTFSTLIELARGDSILTDATDEEDGELDGVRK